MKTCVSILNSMSFYEFFYLYDIFNKASTPGLRQWSRSVVELKSNNEIEIRFKRFIAERKMLTNRELSLISKSRSERNTTNSFRSIISTKNQYLLLMNSMTKALKINFELTIKYLLNQLSLRKEKLRNQSSNKREV